MKKLSKSTNMFYSRTYIRGIKLLSLTILFVLLVNFFLNFHYTNSNDQHFQSTNVPSQEHNVPLLQKYFANLMKKNQTLRSEMMQHVKQLLHRLAKNGTDEAWEAARNEENSPVPLSVLVSVSLLTENSFAIVTKRLACLWLHTL